MSIKKRKNGGGNDDDDDDDGTSGRKRDQSKILLRLKKTMAAEDQQALSKRRKKAKQPVEEEEEPEDGEEELGNGPAVWRNGLMLGGKKNVMEEEDDEEDEEDEDEDDREERKTVQTQISRSQQAAISSNSITKKEAPIKYDGSYRNKQRVLVFCSRGVTARYRHLLEDLRKLIPHHKKDVKLDCKGDLQEINEIAEVKSCNNCVFLEARKRQDLYLWLSKTPLGPSIKFNVLNVHTMDELRMTGNAMLGSRPLLSFDAGFDEHPHTRLMKSLLTDAFGTPRGHPKGKPFIDRIMSFCLADQKVWVRNYQIVDQTVDNAKAEAKAAKKGEEATNLVEIGPRFVLNPIRIFASSFGGPTLYQNPAFLSPNFVRAEKKRTEGAIYSQKMQADEARKEGKSKIVMPKDELADLFRQKSD